MKGKNRRIRALAYALSLALLLPLTGCGQSSGGNGAIFSYSVGGSVGTLDPQFATNSTSQMIIMNTFEGLLIENPQGGIEPGVAESYSVSADGRRYTFKLREDARWSDGQAVTAHDFEFGIKRLFGPQAVSPYARSLVAISGAAQVLDGGADPSTLGVRAVGEHSLEITLDYPHSGLPSLMASSYTMPCRESYFTEQRGRYGAAAKSTIFNGPFVITKFDNTKSINLRRNENYFSDRPTEAGGVNITLAASNPLESFTAGRSDIVKISHREIEQVGDAQLISFGDTVWALLYNHKRSLLASQNIRTGLSAAVDRSTLAGNIEENVEVTSAIVPEIAFVGSEKYRSLVSQPNALRYDAIRCEEIFTQGLRDMGQSKLPFTEMIIPDGMMERRVAGGIQGNWQQAVKANVNLMPLEQSEFLSRVSSGDFDIALVPLSLQGASVSSMLAQFTSMDSANRIAYASEEYDSLFERASQEEDSNAAARLFFQCEQMLIDDAALTPLYTTMSHYAVSSDIADLRVFPYSDRIYFKYAARS